MCSMLSWFKQTSVTVLLWCLYPLERFIVWRYCKAGLRYGEACSHVVVFGMPVNMKSLRQQYKRWEKAYCELGYEPVPEKIFEEVGGGWVGQEKLNNYLYKKRDQYES